MASAFSVAGDWKGTGCRVICRIVHDTTVGLGPTTRRPGWGSPRDVHAGEFISCAPGRNAIKTRYAAKSLLPRTRRAGRHGPQPGPQSLRARHPRFGSRSRPRKGEGVRGEKVAEGRMRGAF